MHNLSIITLQFISCSISLSSLDSEPDSSMTDTQMGPASTVRVITHHRNRDPRSTGGISTHSLNEADLQVQNFDMLKHATTYYILIFFI